MYSRRSKLLSVNSARQPLQQLRIRCLQRPGRGRRIIRIEPRRIHGIDGIDQAQIEELLPQPVGEIAGEHRIGGHERGVGIAPGAFAVGGARPSR